MADKKRKRIPLYIDTETGTRYIQSKRTGLMKGRYGSEELKKLKLRDDGTRVFRADGKKHKIIRRIKQKKGKTYRTGIIFGRVPRGLARASKSTRRRVAHMGGRARHR